MKPRWCLGSTDSGVLAGMRKSFGTDKVLKGIELKVQAGEVIAIIGKSGSGKSTLLERVAITRALAMQPAVRRAAESLATEGMTLPMVTHEMNFARKVADRVVFMHQGLVHEIGAPEVLFTNPQHRSSSSF
jgi:ABC-type polar amino acid transport system ATPase subunit